MIFAAPTFLFLLPLAGLPILFHLVLKQKKRTVVFSTLMFFHRVDPKLNTRRKIREWLLLALRVLMIALVLLALSRPAIRSAAGDGGKLSLVVVVDNSGSMSAGSETADATKLACAKEGARKLLSSLEPSADATVMLLAEDPLVAVPESLTTERGALLECLDRIGPTEATGDAHRALAKAFELLHNSTAGGGVVHVFSDLQRAEWSENAGWALAHADDPGMGGQGQDGLKPILRGFESQDDRMHVYLHRIGASPQQGANVAVTGIQFPEQRLFVGQPYEVGLALRNTSDSAADIRVNCIDSRGERGTRSLSLQRQEATTVGLPMTMGEQGHHWLKAWVEGDGFAADNAAGVGLFCEGMGTVLFIGEPRQFGVLPMALSPSEGGQLTGLVTKFSQSVQDVADRLETKGEEQHGLKPILLVTTWDWLEAASGDSAVPTSYVEGGGSLLVVPSLSRGYSASATQRLSWAGAGLRAREAYKSGVRLEVMNRDCHFWRQIERIVGDISTERIAAYAFCPLDLGTGFTPLLGAGASKVVLAHKSLGKGNIFVSGTAFSSRWNTLPLSGLGVVMAQRMAVGTGPVPNSQGGSPSRMSLLVAGERPKAWSAGAETQILSLTGDALEWKGRSNEVPAFPRTGVYLMTAGADKCCVSVRASDKESERLFIEGSTVPVLGPIGHTVVSFDPDADYSQYHAGQTRAVEMYIPMLLLLMLAMLFEGLLGASRVRSRSWGILPVSSWARRPCYESVQGRDA